MLIATEPLPAINEITANNILITGDYGIGKSGLLASTGYTLADPEDKLRAYSCPRNYLKDWAAHKDFVKSLAALPKGKIPGIGLDSLNVSYDHAAQYVMDTVKFNGITLKHPSENPQMCYPRITHEFITWLREVTYLGYHVVATCHTNVAEVRDKKGASYHRWIPAFTGSSPTSTYAAILKVFSIVGFMTIEDVIKPTTVLSKERAPKPVVDIRADATRIEMVERRVIHFNQSPNWLANNKEHGFPDTVTLTERWQDDWTILKEAWGIEGPEIVEEEIETTGQQVEVGK